MSCRLKQHRAMICFGKYQQGLLVDGVVSAVGGHPIAAEDHAAVRTLPPVAVPHLHTAPEPVTPLAFSITRSTKL